jgi:hypothetical protein
VSREVSNTGWTKQEHDEAMRDPAVVEFRITGRNGKTFAFRFPVRDNEQGTVAATYELDNETEDVDMGLSYMETRLTGRRHMKVAYGLEVHPASAVAFP